MPDDLISYDDACDLIFHCHPGTLDNNRKAGKFTDLIIHKIKRRRWVSYRQAWEVKRAEYDDRVAAARRQ